MHQLGEFVVKPLPWRTGRGAFFLALYAELGHIAARVALALIKNFICYSHGRLINASLVGYQSQAILEPISWVAGTKAEIENIYNLPDQY